MDDSSANSHVADENWQRKVGRKRMSWEGEVDEAGEQVGDDEKEQRVTVDGVGEAWGDWREWVVA